MARYCWRFLCVFTFLLLAACVPTSGSFPVKYRTTHDGPLTVAGVSLDASLDRPAFGPGEPILLHVRAVNAGTSAVYFPHMRGDEFLFLVVTDAGGRSVGKTAAGLQHYPDSEFLMGSPAIQHLTLGTTTTFNIPVSDYYVFGGPGPYTISAYARFFVDGTKEHTVVSNVVSFTVQ